MRSLDISLILCVVCDQFSALALPSWLLSSIGASVGCLGGSGGSSLFLGVYA